MENKLNILILEDLISDAELAKREVKKVINNVSVTVVDTEVDYVRALKIFKPDLVISDYKMPNFDGMTALKILKEKSDTIPFIILTGSMNEEIAVECMKAGADDYVIKEHIKRLGQAVLGALEKKKIESERLENEKALKIGDRKYRNLFENAPDGIMQLDSNANIIDCNRSECKLLGYKRNELIGKHIAEILTKESKEISKKAFLKLKKEGHFEAELSTVQKDGTILPIWRTANSVHNEEGEFIGAIVHSHDISNRKQAEYELRKSDELNKAAINSLPGIFYMFNKKGRFVKWNKNLELVSEYSSDEVAKSSPLNYFTGATKKRIASKILSVFNKGEATVEGELLTKSGERIPHYLTGKRMTINKKTYLLGVGMDISDRVRAEKLQSVVYNISRATHSTKNLDELYKLIHKILKDVIDVTNFYIAYFNEKEQMLSFPFYKDEADDFPESAEPFGNGITEYVIKTGKPLLLNRKDIENYNRKGKFEAAGAISEQWLGAPLKIENRVIGVIAVNSYHDPDLYSKSDLKILTFVSEQIAKAIEQKQAINDLQVEKTYLNELFTYSPEALALVTTDNTILHINKHFTLIFGYEEEEIIGRNIDKLLIPPEQWKEAHKYTDEVASGKRVNLDALRKKKDGSMVNVSVLGSPINYKGDILAVYVIYRDITDRITALEKLKKSEERYRHQSEELNETNSMKELLLDVIAHDLRNPAGVIKGFAEFGLEMDPNNEILKEIGGGVDNLLKVISDATTLSKVAIGDDIIKEKLNLTDIINIAINENSSQLQLAEMTLEMKIKEKLIIAANPIIGEIFRNYISNAIKYAQSGKKVIIDAIIEKKNVTINFMDFGTTIDNQDRENIFMRNVQLGKTKGRGLGLAIVKRIAEAHDAEAGVKPNKPKGNNFYIKIPI